MVNAEMLVSQHLQQQCSVEYSTADVRIYKCILYHRLGDHDGREGVKEARGWRKSALKCCLFWTCVGACSGRNQLGIPWEGAAELRKS